MSRIRKMELISGEEVTVDADNYERLNRYEWRKAFVGYPYDDHHVVMERDDGKVCLMGEVVVGMADLDSGERDDALELFLADPETGVPIELLADPEFGRMPTEDDLKRAGIDEAKPEEAAESIRAILPEIEGQIDELGGLRTYLGELVAKRCDEGMDAGQAQLLAYGVTRPLIKWARANPLPTPTHAVIPLEHDARRQQCELCERELERDGAFLESPIGDGNMQDAGRIVCRSCAKRHGPTGEQPQARIVLFTLDATSQQLSALRRVLLERHAERPASEERASDREKTDRLQGLVRLLDALLARPELDPALGDGNPQFIALPLQKAVLVKEELSLRYDDIASELGDRQWLDRQLRGLECAESSGNCLIAGPHDVDC